ncbi:MAG: ABC transporter permease, partial [Bacteroidota bacterium]
ISVQSAVDSLENNIKESFEELGNDVVYIDKMPWNEDPNTNYWKYLSRPDPSIDDYDVLKRKLKKASDISYSIFAGVKTLKHKSNFVQGAFMLGATEKYKDIFNIDLEKGRFYNNLEYRKGTNVIVIGYSIAEELFGKLDPINKVVKIQGQKFQIIGVIKKEGKSLISVIDFDNAVIASFNTIKKLINVNSKTSFGKTLTVKAKVGVSNDELKDEIVGVLRSKRKLKPKEKNNFATNTLSILDDLFESFFGTLSIGGWLIGGFAIFVGMFSVANIMFVSVKERTNIIGVKKALGAKRFMILLEFLIEAIILCIIGGIIGLLFVWGVLALISSLSGFQMALSTSNIMIGLVFSVIIGLLAGMIPAFQASKMDPVEAIRA